MYTASKPGASKASVNMGGWLVWKEINLVKKQDLGGIEGTKTEHKIKQVPYVGPLGQGLLFSPVLSCGSETSASLRLES